MRLRMTLLASMIFCQIGQTKVLPKVVYGEDNRIDSVLSENAILKEAALSTAAMMSNYDLDFFEDHVIISGNKLKDDGVCESARFASQLAVATCSGFLVGEDLLVTAGHCIESKFDCDRAVWVFDYHDDGTNQDEITVPKSSVYRCSKIVSRALVRSTNDDYALIQLDRKVTDRPPLSFRREGKIDDNAQLVVIGHPSGLPTKMADGAFVRDNGEAAYFVTNTDTFGGNSGSAVLDAQTGMVEGILVRGENDYTYSSELKCRVPLVCTMLDCRGEDVSRITRIKALMDLTN